MPKGVYVRTETTRKNLSKARKGKHYLKLSESMLNNKNALKPKSVADIIKKMEEEQTEEQISYLKTVIRKCFLGEK